MTAADRIPCLVPGCRRTAPASKYPAGTRIICGKCWRRVPRELRRRQAKIRRLYSRRQTAGLRGTLDRVWRQIEAEATAAAAGEITDASAAAFLAAP